MKFEVLVGRLGRNPELKEIVRKKDGGKRLCCNFSLAVDRPFSDITDWYDCSMFGERAAVIEKYFSKGSPIVVAGYSKPEGYIDRNGSARCKIYFDVSDFAFCGSSVSGNYTAKEPAQQAQAQAYQPAQDPIQQPKQQPAQQSFADLPDSLVAQEEDIPF